MGQIKLFAFIALTVLFVQLSHSASIPSDNYNTCGCSRNYAPVCATDGITYGNECLFLCEKEIRDDIQIKHDGVCAPNETGLEPTVDCVCTQEFKPICGTDGVTYSNACNLKCAQKRKDDLEAKHDGECDVKIEKLPLEEDPDEDDASDDE